MYLLRRGDKRDFIHTKMAPGETALIMDTKEVAFCFGDSTAVLKVSEEVGKETAEKLISCITEFLQNNPRFVR